MKYLSAKNIMLASMCCGLYLIGNITSTWINRWLSVKTGQPYNPDYSESYYPGDVTIVKDESYPLKIEHDAPFSTLLDDYKKLIEELKNRGWWKSSRKRGLCHDKLKQYRCVEPDCTGPVTLDPEESLRSMRRSVEDADLDTLTEVTRLLRPKYTHKKVLFVTAASSNHFREAQALIQNLNDYVFPLVTNYRFVFYDLGFTTEERSQLEQYGGCEVRTFPLSAMPERFKELRCYVWKPLIIQANLPTTETLIYIDPSIRFKNRTILDILQQVEQTRLSILNGMASIAYHTLQPMFDYFEEKTCSFTHLPELSVGLMGFKNDRFVRQAVMRPWAACAINPHCMCPEHSDTFLNCQHKVWRKYNHCHRPEQSALGIIISKLFRGHEENFILPSTVVNVRREHGVNYFDDLKSKSSNVLFKDFGPIG